MRSFAIVGFAIGAIASRAIDIDWVTVFVAPGFRLACIVSLLWIMGGLILSTSKGIRAHPLDLFDALVCLAGTTFTE
jgi:hypothetical protein